jgi:hypothetical protein
MRRNCLHERLVAHRSERTADSGGQERTGRTALFLPFEHLTPVLTRVRERRPVLLRFYHEVNAAAMGHGQFTDRAFLGSQNQRVSRVRLSKAGIPCLMQ